MSEELPKDVTDIIHCMVIAGDKDYRRGLAEGLKLLLVARSNPAASPGVEGDILLRFWIERLIIEAEKDEREGDPSTLGITRTGHIAHVIARALAQRSKGEVAGGCPSCGGPADNGYDRCYPPNPYDCTKCTPKPAEAVHSKEELED